MTSRWTVFDFGVSRSKVKFAVTLNDKMVSAYFLENFFITLFSYLASWLVMTSRLTLFDFGFSMSKVKFTVTLNDKIVSSYFLENYLSFPKCESMVRKGGIYVVRHFFYMFFSIQAFLRGISSEIGWISLFSWICAFWIIDIIKIFNFL